MLRIIGAVVAFIALLPAIASAQLKSPHAAKTLEIYRRIVEVDTSKNRNNTIAVARYLADELIAGGIPEKDVEVLEVGDFGSLVARYRGSGETDKRPILLLAHIDVVEALAEDWERPPFELTEDDNYFYARGSIDNKFGVAQLTSTFIRLRSEGFEPDRDLLLVFTGDEESGMQTTRKLAYERPDIAAAEYALNSDAGGGDLDVNGTPLLYIMQSAEKTYVTWEITVTNPGGHSSRPRPDNAIYDLSDAIGKIRDYRFPVRWSEMTLAYFQETGNRIGGELGEVMLRFAYDPTDTEASDRLAVESSYVGTTRTTCVVTMLRAGHAENALPQSATATVNCRVFPGVPVSDIEATLRQVVDNEGIEFRMLGDPTESPISELRDDVTRAVSRAVHDRFPGLTLIPSMESGGTDGMHFRKAGIPTWGISGIFMNPDEMYAHGLNERVPKAAFFGALDHWSTIIRELTGSRP